MGSVTGISGGRKQLGPPKPVALDPLPAQPLVTILISNHNYAAYVGEAIESALRQTYDRLEIVICDDGSTDGSPRILERYRSLDRRIRVASQANEGQPLVEQIGGGLERIERVRQKYCEQRALRQC
jgi:cellulose synthase/poly-beta-1,6-N-acetylglucosamine synthase-like glycosyltransferase